MTSVCVGAVASHRKTGIPTRIYADPAFVAAALPSALKWLVPFLPYLPPIYFDVDAFCADEPPGTPTLVEATIAAVLAGGEAGAAFVAAQLVWEVIQNQLWYQWCECTSGTQPTPPTGQSPPSNLPTVNPPALLPPSSATPCQTFGPITVVSTNGAVVDVLGHGASPFTTIPLPAQTTSFHVVSTITTLTGTNDTGRVTFEFFNLAGVETGTSTLAAFGPNATQDAMVAVPSGTVAIAIVAGGTHAFTNTIQYVVQADAFCLGAVPGEPSPCSGCPPDPVLTGMLSQILGYVTLLQRQMMPFAYVTGAVHTGLSGAGNFDIQGLLGVLVNVTTLPSHFGREGSSPTELFDLGWLTFGTDDGYPQGYRLQRTDQVLTPARCSLFTNLAYDLSPGVVITVTELHREP